MYIKNDLIAAKAYSSARKETNYNYNKLASLKKELDLEKSYYADLFKIYDVNIKDQKLLNEKEDIAKLYELLNLINMPFELSDDPSEVKKNIKMYKLALRAYGTELNNINSQLNSLRQGSRHVLLPGQPDPVTGMVSSISREIYTPLASEDKAEIKKLESRKQEILNKLAFKNNLDANINKSKDIKKYFQNRNLIREKEISLKALKYFVTIKDLWDSVKV